MPESVTTAPPSSAPQAGDPNANTTPPASNVPSPAPEPQAPRGLRGSGLRYDDVDGVPTWARGKTADEILATATQLYDALQRGGTPSSTPPATPSPSPAPRAPARGVDPDLVYTNPAEYTRQLTDAIRAEMRSEIASAAGSVTMPLASLARAEAARNPKRALVWERYAPEIEAMVARLPEGARARPDIWDEAAKMVAGEHIDELARAQAERLIASHGDAGTLSTSGGRVGPGTSTPASPLEKLWNEDHPSIRGFKTDNISLSKVREWVKAKGHTEESYAKLLTDRMAWRARA